MKYRTIGLIIAGGIVLTMIGAAFAQGVACGPVKDIVSTLSGEKYDERPAFTGTIQGMPATIFANRKTGSWTAVFFTPDGQACMFAAGRDFDEAPAEAPGEPT